MKVQLCEFSARVFPNQMQTKSLFELKTTCSDSKITQPIARHFVETRGWQGHCYCDPQSIGRSDMMQFVMNIDQPQSLVSVLKLLPKGRKRNQGSWIFSTLLFAMMNDLSSLCSWHCFCLLVIVVSHLLCELTY